MGKRRVVISQPMFFPWVGMYEQVKLADVYVHYDDVQFSKGSFTNRVQVKSPKGSSWLTVPLERAHLGQAINDIRISSRSNWRKSHLGTLAACYTGAPHFREMMDLVEQVYEGGSDNLATVVKASLMAGCRYLGLEQNREFIDVAQLGVSGEGSQRVLDIVRKLDGAVYVTGHGARNYLDHQAFEDAGVRVEYMDYQKRPYAQLNGAFTPYVSVLDLIANTGRDGVNMLVSGTRHWREFLHGRD